MDKKADVVASILKYLTGENEQICRLCCSSIEKQGVYIYDTVLLHTPYYDGDISYVDLLTDLCVSIDKPLPTSLCLDCANIIINTFLFKRLCQYSDKQWEVTLDTLENSLKKTDNMGDNFNTIYLIQDDSYMFTSKAKHLPGDKKNVIIKLKEMTKSKNRYAKIKRGKEKKIKNTICVECGDQFSSNYYLSHHTMKVHNKKQFRCLRCSKTFLTSTQLKGHEERVHYPKKIKCTKCKKAFSTQKILQYHDREHHMAVICKICFIQVRSRHLLRMHMDKHEVNKCEKCRKIFNNKSSFKNHLRICGELNKEHQFFCDICNKSYLRKNGLRTHLKTNHGFGQVYSCSWCGKKYDAISRLNSHMVKHTRERNFHCEHCGGKFVTQAALTYHIRLHTGERPFPCDMCSESFLSASRRMEHKRRKHLGPNRECPICHLKFSTSHELKTHVKRHYNPHSKLFVPGLDKEEKVITQNNEQSWLY